LSLVIKSTKALVTPENFRWKVLIFGPPGVGKTEWLTGVPDIGVAACENGQGSGLLTAASRDVQYVEPENLAELESFCKGDIFKDKPAVGLDSLSDMSRTLVKDAVLKIPRTRGDSDKRKRGVMELDDYGISAEITRKLLATLIKLNKHVIVTATERYQAPDAETGVGETIIGPDLPGQMFTASPAMFDTVLRLRTRRVLRNPNDAKSRYVERYFLTQPDGQGSLAKCRNSLTGKPLLDKEEVFDLADGRGTFSYLLAKILAGYAENLK
jgi:hypothetical protein